MTEDATEFVLETSARVQPAISRQLASNSSREYWISVCVRDTSSCENARFSCSWKKLLAAGSSMELNISCWIIVL